MDLHRFQQGLAEFTGFDLLQIVCFVEVSTKYSQTLSLYFHFLNQGVLSQRTHGTKKQPDIGPTKSYKATTASIPTGISGSSR